MRIRTSASASPRAAMAVARLLGLTPREAKALLAQARVLPAELDGAAVEAACAVLRAEGVEAEAVDVPPTSSRCAAHPSLTGETYCEDCRQLICPLCAPRCAPCASRKATAARWRRARIGLLLVVLAGVALWGVARQRALERRTAWLRPLRVAVVLVSPEPIPPDVREAWSGGLVALEAWFADESARFGLPLEHPVVLSLAPVAVLAEPPAAPDPTGDFLVDARDAVALRAQLMALARRGEARSDADAYLVVALKPPAIGPHRVEGIGEAEGTIGMVEGTAGDTAITLELVALAHEVLHLVGARDGYDEQGHALVPRGLVEPDRGYPQRFAEVMVGELPLAPGAGRSPKQLDEVRVGEVTAREIGWRR